MRWGRQAPPRLSAPLSLLLLLVLTPALSTAQPPAPLRLLAARPDKDSLVAHHATQPPEGLAVRVGTPFVLALEFSRPLPLETVLRLGVRADTVPPMQLPVFAHEGRVYTVVVQVPLEAPPGPYDNICVYAGSPSEPGVELPLPMIVQVLPFLSPDGPLSILQAHVLRWELFKRRGAADYRIPLGLAVRRGDSFLLRITLSKELSGPRAFRLWSPSHPQLRLAIVDLHRRIDVRYTVRVTVHEASPVGRFTDVHVGVRVSESDAGGPNTTRWATWRYPWPVYVVFNAYRPGETIYLRDEAERREYLENERGLVFNGPLEQYETIPWYYGQFSQDSLDAAFYLLRACTTDTTDPLPVVRCLVSRILGSSANTDGVVLPRWTDYFPDGVPPDEWSSSDGILRQWLETNHTPVKYGQCWVVASITCTLLRALGIPARQVIAFGAAQDDSARLDARGLPHHMVLNYLLPTGRLVKQLGRVWRFHSWVDIWMRRPDLPPRYSGWQSVDATELGGRGLGPASVRAIYEQRYDLPYNATEFVGTLHPVIRDVLLDCDPALPVSPRVGLLDMAAHCTYRRTLRTSQAPVPLVVTTAVGAYRMRNLTAEFMAPHARTAIPGLPHLPAPGAVATVAVKLRSRVKATRAGMEVLANVTVSEATLAPQHVHVTLCAELGPAAPDRDRPAAPLGCLTRVATLQPQGRCSTTVAFRLLCPAKPSAPLRGVVTVRAVAADTARLTAAYALQQHPAPSA